MKTTATTPSGTRDAGDRAQDLAERHGPTVARAGWAAKGVVYAIVGVLTLQLALGDSSSQAPDQQGALRAIADQSFGSLLLVLLVIGLAAYALGRWMEASVLARPGLEAFDRARMIGSGLFYAALAVAAVRILTGSGGGGRQNGARSVTAGVLDAPLGRWLVGAVGLAFIAAGVYEGWKGVTKRFLDDLETGSMRHGTRELTERVGMAGLVARGIAWALVGWFLVQAAVQFDPSEAKGLDQALRSVADEPWGTAVLLVVALGFVAYGVYCAVQARFHSVGEG